MSIQFPNFSRSFDATRNAVRFWGYDSTIECSFFVTRAALKRLVPGLPTDETALLGAFDEHRNAICHAAEKVYQRGVKGSYELDEPDF